MLHDGPRDMFLLIRVFLNIPSASSMGGGKRKETSHQKGLPYVKLLTDCAKKKDLHSGTALHADILKRGLLQRSPYISSSLIWMYARCGALVKAREVLDGHRFRDAVCWSTLIAGYAEDEQAHESLKCYGEMQREGVSPNEVTFICVLKACGSIGALGKGKQIHEEIISKGMAEKNMMLGTAVVDMYAKCGALRDARQAFEWLPIRDTVSWSVVVAGYAQQETAAAAHEALACLEQMQSEGVPPNEVTYACALKACRCARAIEMGKKIHHEVSTKGFLEKNTILGNALVDMYARCGTISDAHVVFEGIPVRNVVTWCALISGYATNGRGHEALLLFEAMQAEGLSPDAATFPCILAACGTISAADVGERIHEEILSRDLLTDNVVVGNAVVDMYAKCGRLAKAHQVLEGLPARNVASWSALIAGYAQDGRAHEALACLERMRREGVSPNEVTLACVLKACGSAGAMDEGRQVLAEIIRRDLDPSVERNNRVLGTALVDMYAKCGMLREARQVFQGIGVQDTVSWSALIAGYAREQEGHEALDCFGRMQKKGVLPDKVTYVSVIKACASVGAAESGKRIHEEIARSGLLAKDIVINNALVDMYAKCGMIAASHQVLEDMPIRNAISWNALIAGYARQGQADKSLICFARMQAQDGISPDAVTFLCVLDACRHSDQWDPAQMLYESMRMKFDMSPLVAHQARLVGALGCAGRFEMAMQTMEGMPWLRDPSLWLTLLGACRKWGNVWLAKSAFHQASTTVQGKDDHLDSSTSTP